MLFLFMISGLAAGLVTGWLARPRLRGLRLRLPHLHVHHDLHDTDRATWTRAALGGVDARVKLAVVAGLLVVNLMAGWVFSLVLALLSLGLILIWQRVRGAVVLVRLIPAIVVGVMLVLLRGFTIPGEALFSFDLTAELRVAFSAEGALAGAGQALVVLAGVSLMLLLGLTTPLPSLLRALRWYRVPGLLIEIGLLMYRYLFLFVEEAGRLRQAQKLRGPEVPWRRAMGGFSSLGATLLIRSYDRSQRVYDAQRLRGGGGSG
jgi:cobalt/nickel transport system permease protein